tara:strand:- start:885 stop:986 length:102 start_codon:yes stop_codon:yes gene_type:complete
MGTAPPIQMPLRLEAATFSLMRSAFDEILAPKK